MEPEPFDLDALIGHWRGAFTAAQEALRAGSHDLSTSELRARETRLVEERVATVRLLEALAYDENEKPQLVRLVSSPWETKRLLGLPPDVTACIFSVDGVLVGSATVHAEAWRLTFDDFSYEESRARRGLLRARALRRPRRLSDAYPRTVTPRRCPRIPRESGDQPA